MIWWLLYCVVAAVVFVIGQAAVTAMRAHDLVCGTPGELWPWVLAAALLWPLELAALLAGLCWALVECVRDRGTTH